MSQTRGQRFHDKFSKKEKEENNTYKPLTRGRSVELLEKRNEKIFHRYYYYTRILQFSFANVMAALTTEFDLSESTIGQLIANNAGTVTMIGNKKLSRLELKKLYPCYSWADKALIIEAKPRQVYDRY